METKTYPTASTGALTTDPWYARLLFQLLGARACLLTIWLLLALSTAAIIAVFAESFVDAISSVAVAYWTGRFLVACRANRANRAPF